MGDESPAVLLVPGSCGGIQLHQELQPQPPDQYHLHTDLRYVPSLLPLVMLYLCVVVGWGRGGEGRGEIGGICKAIVGN